MAKRLIKNGSFTGERALFATRDAVIEGSRFFDGESPLKESSSLEVKECTFEWKYPLWYCKDVTVRDTYFAPTARSGIWYTDNIEMSDCVIDAPKTFRRGRGISLHRVSILNAQETLWSCEDVLLDGVSARGDYLGMNSKNVTVNRLRLSGNYAFDGGENITVTDSVLYSKDAFWNCKNVTVINCTVVGEYLGWNSSNVRFVNCDIESDQGLCYMDGVVLENCRFSNTGLAFEYSTVDADVRSHIDSVKNPTAGVIVADSIGEIIHDPACVDTSKTEIKVRKNECMTSTD